MNLEQMNKFDLVPEPFKRHLKIDENGCWIWTSNVRSMGYGVLRRSTEKGKKVIKHTVHRHIKEIFDGGTDGKLVLHQCDVPACCNPDHLYIGTHKDNSNDMFSRGRGNRAYGKRNAATKLTEEQVREIRKSDKTQVELAKMYGVVQSVISSIKRRELWRHIE